MNFLTVLVILGVIFALSFLVESLVEYIFAPLFDHIPAITRFKWVLKYISGAVGILGAFLLSLDLLYLLANFLASQMQVAVPPVFSAVTWYGMLLTGIAISRGANYLHDFVSKYFVKPKMPEAVG